MTTAKPKVIREEYRLPVNHPDHDRQTPFGELRYRILPDGRHSVSLATAGNVITETYPTVEQARDHWRKAREVLTGLGYERVKFTIKDGYVNVFKKGQPVWVSFPNGTEEPGIIANLPGERPSRQNVNVPRNRYHVRFWDVADPDEWYHVIVAPERIRVRD